MVDAAFMLGKVKPQGAATVNAVVGFVMLVAAIFLASSAKDSVSLITSGLAMAFCIFYLILAWDLFGDYDLAGLGWYCLGAGVYVALASYFYFTAGDVRFGIFAISWAVLFLAAFGSLALQKAWGKFIGWLLAVESIVTLLIPAFLMFIGKW